MDNDTRGWIMSLVSGLACVFGASIICVDILMRRLPGKRNFRIQDSDIFLAASLSLSFGVMIFSALFGMLPSARNYLMREDFSASAASWILVLCFVLGFLGIQIVSRLLHRYMPSHVVDCDHSHEEDGTDDHGHSRNRKTSSYRYSRAAPHHHEHDSEASESSPLLRAQSSNGRAPSEACNKSHVPDGVGPKSRRASLAERRPSMRQVQNRVMSFVRDTKENCDQNGPCYGYSDPCGHECYRKASLRPKSLRRSQTEALLSNPTFVADETISEMDTAHGLSAPSTVGQSSVRSSTDDLQSALVDADPEAQHHHHVPENAFLSIGLQTSIAIALHKLPEGFITYATNHANPSLGFAVFVALFVHNITEGYAMALPLYLALDSRFWAMFWSALFGGISQPLGAGIAAIWFKLADKRDDAPGYTVYGCMFAVTAGIMTSVALELFIESLSLTHRRNICMAFAFIGMTILAMSNALTGSNH